MKIVLWDAKFQSKVNMQKHHTGPAQNPTLFFLSKPFPNEFMFSRPVNQDAAVSDASTALTCFWELSVFLSLHPLAVCFQFTFIL